VPELPDVTVYVERLDALVKGRTLDGVRLASPFVLRSVTPPIAAVAGQEVTGTRRLGKRIVIALGNGLFLVIHLMIAGRLRWRPTKEKVPKKLGLVAFDFPNGTLLFTEASAQKRAWLRVVEGEAALSAFDPGGLDVFTSSPESFAGALRRENHTLKRALTDPTLFDGIGNAYSDEILHRARLSPVTLTSRLTAEEITRLHASCRDTLLSWIETLRRETGDGFPEKVTAFREEMAVHGKFQKPCPVCGSPVQRIVYSKNEVNYCPGCQTGGKLLADRALSRLLKGDWPRSLDEMEERLEARREG
jgi:formamidopyrimidine-DNA glycosylase